MNESGERQRPGVAVAKAKSGDGPKAATAGHSLRITEIFHSLQGESSSAGRPTTFVRLTGCPLRCQYCDTAYAFTGGEVMSTEAVLQRVNDFPARFVTVTGGEPLAQPGVHSLMSALCDRGYRVSLETGGALDISDVDRRVTIVMDLKTPGSRESHRNEYRNVERLTDKDEVKFVICDDRDYAWAKRKCEELQLRERVGEILFSPSADELAPRVLAEWILRDGIDVRMQIQLHKSLWGDQPGR